MNDVELAIAAAAAGGGIVRERFRRTTTRIEKGAAWDGNLRDNVHFAAGIAVCRAAGAVVTDLRGNPLPPDGDGWGLLAAADEATHLAPLDVIGRLSGDRLAT
jgi:hypothetical protein